MKRIALVLVALNLAACSASLNPFSGLMKKPESPVEKEAITYRPGVEMIVPHNETPVTLVADYRHVLTTRPQPEFSEPEVVTKDEAVQIQEPVEKASPIVVKKKEVPIEQEKDDVRVGQDEARPAQPVAEPSVQVIRPAPAAKPSALSQESATDRAWRRYCDAGRDMTEEDMRIIEKAGYEIPESMIEDCLPPK